MRRNFVPSRRRARSGLFTPVMDARRIFAAVRRALRSQARSAVSRIIPVACSASALDRLVALLIGLRVGDPVVRGGRRRFLPQRTDAAIILLPCHPGEQGHVRCLMRTVNVLMATLGADRVLVLARGDAPVPTTGGPVAPVERYDNDIHETQPAVTAWLRRCGFVVHPVP